MSGWAAAFLVTMGLFVGCQILKGNALERLGVVSS